MKQSKDSRTRRQVKIIKLLIAVLGGSSLQRMVRRPFDLLNKVGKSAAKRQHNANNQSTATEPTGRLEGLGDGQRDSSGCLAPHPRQIQQKPALRESESGNQASRQEAYLQAIENYLQSPQYAEYLLRCATKWSEEMREIGNRRRRRRAQKERLLFPWRVAQGLWASLAKSYAKPSNEPSSGTPEQ